MLRQPGIVDLLECHVEFIGDIHIREALQRFLRLRPGGVGANGDPVLSGQPRFFAGTGQLGYVAGAVGSLGVLPLGRLLPFAAIRTISLSFYIFTN